MKFPFFLRRILIEERILYCFLSNVSLFFQFVSVFTLDSKIQELLPQVLIPWALICLVFLIQTTYILNQNTLLLRNENRFIPFIMPSLFLQLYWVFCSEHYRGYYIEFPILMFQFERLLKDWKAKSCFILLIFTFLGVRFKFFVYEPVMSMLYLCLFFLLILKRIVKRMKKKKNTNTAKTSLAKVESPLNTKDDKHVSDFEILKHFNTGIALFDETLNIQWHNEAMLKINKKSSFMSSQQLENEILNIQIEEKSMFIKGDEINKKMKQACEAFQSKIGIFSLCKLSNDQKSCYKSPTIKSLSKHSETRKSKSISKFDLNPSRKTLEMSQTLKLVKQKPFFLNQNMNIELVQKNDVKKEKLLKEVLTELLQNKKSTSFGNLEPSQLKSLNLYGFKKQSNAFDAKTIFFITVFQFKNDYFICLHPLDDNDMIHSLYNSHLWQSKQLASMTHELRTPLNSITNILEMLRITELENEENNDQEKEYLNQAVMSSKLLLGAINDFLDYFSVISNIFELDIKETIVKNMISEINDLFEWRAELNNLDFTINVDANIPTVIRTDENRLKQVLLNLISNAFRFTSSGSIFVKMKAKRSNFIKIIVEDTGSGIPLAVLPKLANFTSKVENENSSVTGGFGLCVANYLANYLISSEDNLDSKVFTGIKVKTESNFGSQFSFYVKNHNIEKQSETVLTDNNETNEDNKNIIKKHFQTNEYLSFNFLSMKKESYFDKYLSNSSEQIHCECPKVLAVDDNPFNLFVLSESFKKINIKIDLANGSNEVIKTISECLKSNTKFCSKCGFYQLILMDIDMPIKNGFETTIEIKKIMSEFNKNVPVVALSAFNQADFKKKAQEAGMDSYMEKPFTPEKLDLLVSKYLKN